jgi:hypothetical protein
MADMDRVELLIGLSNNLRKDNDAWRKQVWKEGREKAELTQAMLARLEQEYGLLNQEFELVKQYLPRQQQQLPEERPKQVTGART